MKPAVSVVVPTYNRGAQVRYCLDALLTQYTRRLYEIVVVDDGSTDDTASVVEQCPPVRLIRQQNAGPARARNRGVEEAQGDVVLFTDDDCVPQADWLDRMAAPLDDPKVAGVKGAYLTRQTALVARFVQIEYEEKYDRLRKRQTIDFVDSYSAAFRRSVFLEAGGYDTDFPTASVEDQEFSFRLAAAGRVLLFIPEARVWHSHADTLAAYVRKKFKIGYWKVLLLVKNPRRAVGDSHTPHTLKMQILLAAAFLPACLAAAIGGWGFSLPAGIALAFAGTTLPLTARCAACDPAVGLLAPAFIACRAAGLTAGLLAGLVRTAARGGQ
jgi:glycosyltransferase involved in cell wall biosynthesis